jgi:hypothetical protein
MVQVRDANTDSQKMLTWEQLRQHGIDFYRSKAK